MRNEVIDLANKILARAQAQSAHLWRDQESLFWNKLAMDFTDIARNFPIAKDPPHPLKYLEDTRNPFTNDGSY